MAQYAVSLSGPLEDALLEKTGPHGAISQTIRWAVQAYLMPDHPELVKPATRRTIFTSTSGPTMRAIEKTAAEKGTVPSEIVRNLLEEVFGE